MMLGFFVSSFTALAQRHKCSLKYTKLKDALADLHSSLQSIFPPP